MTPVKKTTRATVKKKVSRKTVAPRAKRAIAAKKAAPLQNAAPIQTPKETSPASSAAAGPYLAAVGRRKTSVANIRLYPEVIGQAKQTSSFSINGKDLKVYFQQGGLVDLILAPLARGNANSYIITCRVQGGGVHSQAEAIRLALCRALVAQEEGRRKEFKDLGYLTRDPRMKERKKYGLKKARRAAQWSKR